MILSAKMKKIIIPLAVAVPVIIVSLSGIFIRSSCDWAGMIDRKTPVEVIYVPGWRNKGVPQNERLDSLKRIFPERSSISVEQWDSQGELHEFKDAVRRADEHAADLAKRIASLPAAKRENLVLVGHSLGGRIVIRTMALLGKKGISIRRGIFLGAAVPDNDPEIGLAIRASTCPNVNIYNRGDDALSVFYKLAETRRALGAYGFAMKFQRFRLQQFSIRRKRGERSPAPDLDFKAHDAELYLERLIEVFGEKAAKRRDAIGSIGKCTKFFWAGLFWHEVARGAEKGNAGQCPYKIERNCVTGANRLISSSGHLLRVGSLKQCGEELDSLTKTEDANSASRINAVKVPGGTSIEVIDDKGLLWKTLEEFRHWKLQKNAMTNRYRIVDPRDFRRAVGSGEKMRKAFESVKKQLRESGS